MCQGLLMPEEDHPAQPQRSAASSAEHSNGAMDGLRRAIQVESAAIRAYERFLGGQPNATPDPIVVSIAISHHQRHSILEGFMFSYREDAETNWNFAPTGPFSDLLRDWDQAHGSLRALNDCERRTLAWYHEESCRHEEFIVDVIANRLMPEQTRTSTLMGGLVRRGLTT